MTDRVEVPDVLDTLGMFAAAAGLPEQIEAAAVATRAVAGPYPAHDDVENVVVLGMGVGGDVVREVAGPFMPVPVVVHKGYGMPNFIGPATLVFVLSFSGDTEEAIEAATEAAASGAHLVVVSNGGELAELAGGWGMPHVPVADGPLMPRAAVGALSIPPLVVLEELGLFPGATGWIDAAVEQLRIRRDELLAQGSAAQQLARRIGNQFALIYGGGGLGGVAAQRWKTQLNQNAKVPAFSNQVPELCHNELSGWGQHGDVTRQVFRLVELRHDYEHPQVMRGFDLVNELVDEVVAEIEVVRAAGEGSLAELFDLMFYGDLVSLHLAVQAGVDPGPVPAVDAVRERLAQA